MNIVLIGYRGSGKTTVGQLLADRLKYTFVDTDQLLTKTAGKTIRQIFSDHGEAHFRELESGALQSLAAAKNHVISLGGGAVLAKSNRQLLATLAEHVVYLRADPAELLRRIESDPATAATRPNLTALVGGLDEIRSVLAVREPIYRKMMTVEIDVTKLAPMQVADAILNHVR